jgi:polar amino acid transport system permease protein
MDLVNTFFNWPVFRDALPLLLEGLWITILLGAVSIVAGLVTGLLMALVRLYGILPLRAAARIYIDVFRSIPLLVLLVLVYYALPFVGIRLTSFTAAATALTLVSCAYTAEIFRAGIEALPKGQFEAADAIGLGFFSSMRDVILPQAFRIVVPPAEAGHAGTGAGRQPDATHRRGLFVPVAAAAAGSAGRLF